jgi:hypothetical protein
VVQRFKREEIRRRQNQNVAQRARHKETIYSSVYLGRTGHRRRGWHERVEELHQGELVALFHVSTLQRAWSVSVLLSNRQGQTNSPELRDGALDFILASDSVRVGLERLSGSEEGELSQDESVGGGEKALRVTRIQVSKSQATPGALATCSSLSWLRRCCTTRASRRISSSGGRMAEIVSRYP